VAAGVGISVNRRWRQRVVISAWRRINGAMAGVAVASRIRERRRRHIWQTWQLNLVRYPYCGVCYGVRRLAGVAWRRRISVFGSGCRRPPTALFRRFGISACAAGYLNGINGAWRVPA